MMVGNDKNDAFTCRSFHGPPLHLLGPLSDGKLSVVLLPNLARVVGKFASLIEHDKLVVFLLDVPNYCGHFHAHSTRNHA